MACCEIRIHDYDVDCVNVCEFIWMPQNGMKNQKLEVTQLTFWCILNGQMSI